MVSHPENLPADVRRPLLLQRVALGVLDEVRHRAGAAELHHQLQTNKVVTGSLVTRFLPDAATPGERRRCPLRRRVSTATRPPKQIFWGGSERAEAVERELCTRATKNKKNLARAGEQT